MPHDPGAGGLWFDSSAAGWTTAARLLHEPFGLPSQPWATTSKGRTATPVNVPSFDELLAELLEEPPEVLGVLSDVVNRGRMQAEDLPAEPLGTLAEYELVTFLIQRRPGRPVRTWAYPTPLGLRMFGVLEREAERQDEAAPRPRSRRRGKGRATR